MTSAASRQWFGVLACVGAAACGGSEASQTPADAGTPSVTGGSVVGVWSAAKLVLTDATNPATKVDVVAAGGTQALVIDDQGRFSTCTVAPALGWSLEWSGGTATLSGGRLTMTAGPGSSWPPMTIPITFGSPDAFSGVSEPAQVDLDGNGTIETITVEVQYARAKAGGDRSGTWLGPFALGDGSETPVFLDLSDSAGMLAGEVRAPLASSAAAKVDGTADGRVQMAPLDGVCQAPLGARGTLVADKFLALVFDASPCVTPAAGAVVILAKPAGRADLGKPIPNPVQSPGFESGTAPWTIWFKDPSAQGSLATDTTDKHSGAASLRVQIDKPGPGDRMSVTQNGIAVTAGQVGVVSLWARANPSRPGVLYVNHRAAPWTVYGRRPIQIGGTWQRHWALVIPPADDSNAGTYLEMRDAPAGTVWIDDWELLSFQPK